MLSDDERALREKAQVAAEAGDPTVLAQALSEQLIFDGFRRRLLDRWRFIPLEEIDYILAIGVDVLYDRVREGIHIGNVMGYYWKICDHKAHEYHRRQQREHSVDPQELARAQDHAGDPSSDSEDEDARREELRRRAIALARQFLPRLGQENIRKVMAYVIDAVEAGLEDVPNAEVAEATGLSLETVRTSLSRGFRRLFRIAREEGVVDGSVELLNQSVTVGQEGEARSGNDEE